MFVLEVEGNKTQLSSAFLQTGAHQWLSEAPHTEKNPPEPPGTLNGNFHFGLTTKTPRLST